MKELKMNRLMLLLVAVCLCCGCGESLEDGPASTTGDVTQSTTAEQTPAPTTPTETSSDSIEELIATALEGNDSLIEERDGIVYLVETGEPYTGCLKETFEGSEQISGLAQFKDGKWDGLLVGWHANGTMAESGSFKGNVPVGTHTQWYENGQIMSEMTYKNQLLDGRATEWYENGQKRQETIWKADRKDGTEIHWHENGHKSAEATYQDGEFVGKETRWDENGEVIVTKEDATNTYPDIAELVRLIEANGDSVQERLAEAVAASQLRSKDRIRYLVDSDAPFTGWTKHYDKGFLTLKQWSDGRGDGPELSWYSNGRKRSAITLNNGTIEGRFTMWHEDGWKSQEGHYKDGTWDGKETKWYPNGQKKSEATYENGKLVGKETRWDEDGNVISK